MKIGQHIIHWGRPGFFWFALPCIVLALLLLIYRLHKVRSVAKILTRGGMRSKQLQHYSFVRKILKVLLFVVGLFGLTLAMMRPQWQEEVMPVAQKGRDLIVALDISRSMLANDLEPDRLSFAKQKIRQLVTSLKTERVGLMLFSGAAFMQCPLTTDRGAFLMYLDQVDVETISSGTTSIADAIQEAIRLYKQIPQRQHKLLVIFTDGEDFSSNLASLKNEAARVGLHIITVGVGTQEGAPIPLYDRRGVQSGHQLDDDGKVVISRMNSGILHRLAEDTGGLFVPIDTTSADIRKIMTFVQGFKKEHLQDQAIKQFQEQYHYPLLVSFICFALEWLL